MTNTTHMRAVERKGTAMTFASLKTLTAATVLTAALAATPALAAGGAPEVEAQKWSFSGITGKFDKAQLQRGFQVYKEVCSACHGLKFLHWRNLGEAGGPGFTEEQVKALAKENEVQDGPDEEGEMFDRPALPSDSIGGPYANDAAARAANNGALPPDLSLIAKARGVKRPGLGFAPLEWLRDIVSGDETGGADYLYGLLTGYVDEADIPEGFVLSDGMSYNKVFEGHQIAMSAPLDDDAVEYSDGTPQTTSQHAKDVTAFLMWAAEPKLEERKSLGIRVMIYLLILSVLLYLTKRSLWARIKH